jgi:hypothetical protein
VKMDVGRCTAGVQKMRPFQRAESMCQQKPHEMPKTYRRVTKCVVGRAWIGIPAPVAPRSCSTSLQCKCLDWMRVYKCVAYSRFLLDSAPLVCRER